MLNGFFSFDFSHKIQQWAIKFVDGGIMKAIWHWLIFTRTHVCLRKVLLHKVTGNQTYRADIEATFTDWMPGGSIPYTPKGLAYRLQWGSNRYAGPSEVYLWFSNYSSSLWIHPCILARECSSLAHAFMRCLYYVNCLYERVRLGSFVRLSARHTFMLTCLGRGHIIKFLATLVRPSDSRLSVCPSVTFLTSAWLNRWHRYPLGTLVRI